MDQMPFLNPCHQRTETEFIAQSTNTENYVIKLTTTTDISKQKVPKLVKLLFRNIFNYFTA